MGRMPSATGEFGQNLHDVVDGPVAAAGKNRVAAGVDGFSGFIPA